MSLREKLSSNQKPLYFMCYCISLMGTACVITGLGPLIPYLSEQSGI